MTWKARLRALERHLETQTCRECHDHPVRIIGTNPDTGRQWYSDALPESGCPTCGRPPTVIEISSPEPIDLAKL